MKKIVLPIMLATTLAACGSTLQTSTVYDDSGRAHEVHNKQQKHYLIVTEKERADKLHKEAKEHCNSEHKQMRPIKMHITSSNGFYSAPNNVTGG